MWLIYNMPVSGEVSIERERFMMKLFGNYADSLKLLKVYNATLSKRHGLVKIVIQQWFPRPDVAQTYTQVLIKRPINGFVYLLKILTFLQIVSCNNEGSPIYPYFV